MIILLLKDTFDKIDDKKAQLEMLKQSLHHIIWENNMMRKLFSNFYYFRGFFIHKTPKNLIGVPELTFNESKYVLVSAINQNLKSICTRIHFRRRKNEDASAVITIYFFNKNIDAKEATYQKQKNSTEDRNG